MRHLRIAISIAALLAPTLRVPAQADKAEKPQSSCITCHAEPELWEGADKRFFVTPENLSQDIHWQKGLVCQDCHGGDPTKESYAEAHSEDTGFRKMKAPADIPGFCGRCHSDTSYMRRFQPSPRTDQEAEYWTSGHGVRLKESGDPKVANCVSCHGHHGIRAIDDLASPVYPTQVGATCARCHGDAEYMADRQYHGRPLGHGQYESWKKSVHGKAMLEKGDLSAPTCNDCHGNHGALPPEVGSVANACGACHGKVADLFRETRMKHKFEEVGLPGCATCHTPHDIASPTDAMLGMGDGAVCARCHKEGEIPAPAAGGDAASHMRTGIETLRADISSAETCLHGAERLGMEVRTAWFELTKARDALTNARSLIHSFDPERVAKAVGEGSTIARAAEDQGKAALVEHGKRRIWLGISLIGILAMIGILIRFIRFYPVPRAE